MSAFLSNFLSDANVNDSRPTWRTSKPILQSAVVACAPPYPDYPKLTHKPKGKPSTDPSCLWASVPGIDVEVVLYDGTSQGSSSYQQQAWEYILAHANAVETALRRKLFAWHRKQMARHLEEDLPHSKALQKYWKVVEQQIPLNEPMAIDSLFKLVGIGLANAGLDDCGFYSFEFQTGWDRDHGLGILMHRDRVLAAGGITELILGPDPAAGARVVQSYDLDDGDLLLQSA